MEGSRNRSKHLSIASNVLSIVSKYLSFDLAKRLYDVGGGGGGGGSVDVDRLEKRDSRTELSFSTTTTTTTTSSTIICTITISKSHGYRETLCSSIYSVYGNQYEIQHVNHIEVNKTEANRICNAYLSTPRSGSPSTRRSVLQPPPPPPSPPSLPPFLYSSTTLNLYHTNLYTGPPIFSRKNDKCVPEGKSQAIKGRRSWKKGRVKGNIRGKDDGEGVREVKGGSGCGYGCGYRCGERGGGESGVKGRRPIVKAILAPSPQAALL
ncbi:hypothetical protein M0804_006329 [Polistes exclamans]|nr:hypothetical protein M0804_006329 [Polistes exclamans]